MHRYSILKMKVLYKIFFVFVLLANVCQGYAANKTVARVATKQSVLSSGSKVAASTAKSSSCQEKYDSCMDMGCMIDNDSGGRCQCSNQIKDLNAQLSQIKKDIEDATEMEANTVEKIKLGSRANEILSQTSFYEDDEDEEDTELTVSGSIGDKLRAEMHETCAAKIPECKSQLTLVKNMYVQKVKSDCAAFENALKTKGRESRATLAAAEKSVRDAALEQYGETNKYNLGQCVLKFTDCMQITAECGKDFTGCVDTVGKESIYGGVKNQVAISGEKSSILIAKSTMDMLESKKIICESVLNNCEKVRDDVWEAFLKNSAQQIKLAESKSESNIRTSCLENISNCFVNACKENIDGNTSYDACLTRPEMVKSFCKLELEPCLAATGGSYDKPEESTLWPSVLAKLSAMRVDSCTNELKECMQSADRCGPDYSQCVGLDTNIIMRMCPYDKLVGCQKVYGDTAIKGDEIYDEVAQIVEGIILNIDNEMLKTCEASIDNAMTKICGDDESCASYAIGTKIGAQTLRYQVCQYSTDSPDSTKGFKWFDCRESANDISDYELGRNKNAQNEELGPVAPFAGVITGIIKWESVEITDDGHIDIDAYIDAINNQDEEITEDEKNRIIDELKSLQNDINSAISSVESDAFVQFCISGREVPGVTDMFKGNKVRFPQLSNTIRKNIASAALQQAKDNYYRVYDKYSNQMQNDLISIQERLATNLKLNARDAKMAVARDACVNMAAISAFAKAPVGQALWAKIVVGIIIVAAIIVATIFTCGAAGVGVAAGIVGTAAASAGASAGVGAAVAAGAVAGSVSVSVAGTAVSAAAAGMTVAAATAATAAATAAATGVIAGTIVAGTAVTAAAIGGVAADASDAAKINKANKADLEAQQSAITETHGEYFANEWNYREKITTDFDNNTGVCRKCIVATHCDDTKWSLFSDRSCKVWGDPEEPRCTEVQF